MDPRLLAPVVARLRVWRSSAGLCELGHAIHLNQDAEQGGCHGGARRGVVPEELPVDLVELGEPGQVRQVRVDLDDVVEAGSRGLQDRPQVLQVWRTWSVNPFGISPVSGSTGPCPET